MLAFKGSEILRYELLKRVTQLGYHCVYCLNYDSLCYILIDTVEKKYVHCEYIEDFNGNILTAEEFLEL